MFNFSIDDKRFVRLLDLTKRNEITSVSLEAKKSVAKKFKSNQNQAYKIIEEAAAVNRVATDCPKFKLSK